MKDLYTFNDVCMDIAALVRIDFDVNLDAAVYVKVFLAIDARWQLSCKENEKPYDQDLLGEVNIIERCKLFGPF